MAEVLEEVEAIPAAWPAVVGHHPLRDAEAVDEDKPTVDPALSWHRIEAWTARRWPARTVVYVLRGPGEWTPRLHPFVLTTWEWWNGMDWEAEAPQPGPTGYVLGHSTYRATGTAGDDTAPPEPVLEAWRRLHEYSTGVARNWWNEAAVYAEGDRQAPAGWAARAIHLSGAADLLRPWRRLGA